MHSVGVWVSSSGRPRLGYNSRGMLWLRTECLWLTDWVSSRFIDGMRGSCKRQRIRRRRSHLVFIDQIIWCSQRRKTRIGEWDAVQESILWFVTQCGFVALEEWRTRLLFTSFVPRIYLSIKCGRGLPRSFIRSTRANKVDLDDELWPGGVILN